MKFALFYEIPVTAPFTREKENAAFNNTLEQAVLADELGWHGFWTVEHHFLEEFSHCSNPEVLYGAVASRTKNIRIGYGVRLAPKGYNHPVRSAESAAVLDHLSNGRVDFGTGRSSTRLELEGFGIHPDDTRGQWREAIDHIVGSWTNEFHELEGEHWQVPRRRVIPIFQTRRGFRRGHEDRRAVLVPVQADQILVRVVGREAEDRAVPHRAKLLREHRPHGLLDLTR